MDPFYENLPEMTIRKDTEQIDILSDIQDAIRKYRNAAEERIERACEKSLQEGNFGVLVVQDHMHMVISAEPSRFVPYGSIYVIQEEALYGFIQHGLNGFEELLNGIVPPPEEGG